MPLQTDNPLLVGVDFGTTHVGALVYDRFGRVVARASGPTPTHYPRPSWAYLEPEEVWEQTAAVICAVVSKLDDPRQIVSIAIASVGESAVPVDVHGRHTYHAIAWFDLRTLPQLDWLDRTIGKDALFALSGLSLQPIYGLCKLLWFKENEPEAFAKTNRWLHVSDYLAFRLSGAQATDYSLASRTMIMDLRRRRWDEGLLQTVGVAPSIMAPLTQSGTRLGVVTPDAARSTGLPLHTQVAVGGHDHICGALAVGGITPGTMVNSLGSAEALLLPLDQPLTDPAMGRQGYTQGAHVAPDRYYALAGQHTCGASVEWLRDVLGTSSDYAALIAEAEQVPPGSLGVCFLPHLRFASPPYDDPRGRGAYVGLTADANRGVLFRALLEGLALESRGALEPLLAYPGVVPPQDIIAIGGGTRNPLFLQLKATVLNRPITVLDVDEATTLGAAVLGGIGAGVYPDTPTALSTLRYASSVVEPIANLVGFYDTLFRDVYLRLYPTLRTLHHRLSAIGEREA